MTRTACWNLAPEIPGCRDRLNMMGFLFGKLALLDYDGTGLTRRHPPADPFALLAACLDGTSHVRRIDVGGRPDLYAFEVSRAGRGPLQVLWAAGDVFTGEDGPGVPVDWPWPHPTVHGLDAFGSRVPSSGTAAPCASAPRSHRCSSPPARRQYPGPEEMPGASGDAGERGRKGNQREAAGHACGSGG
ncbi:hypothetical protein [Streptomyces decoyicus]|uniref:hypothetical protein n=1 Tax=Streptomyces decoyicus TaxID=249567 RepID=UPI0004AB80F6|nr:hypothetical protein [Streptomyces decoyicus]KOG41385.1 hypothetical protein ADK74_20515 [Streptomyces decoyicus]QZY19867.1 hypothetical protein K7C20_35425 [Streptomyces decoyicus]